MKDRKEEGEFLEKIWELCNEYGVEHRWTNSDYLANRTYIHLDWVVGEDPIKIADEPNHKLVTGCDGGGYLEVKVHE